MSAVEQQAPPPPPSSSKNTIKRDTLSSLEQRMQQKWQDEHIFEQDAPATATSTTTDKNSEKFMATFPYPYMNGKLHLGHAFTLSKVDFAVAFERQQGKRVLFPFAFHCTGMPIKVAADGVRREMEEHGNPPRFPDATDTSSLQGRKSKVASKEGNVVYKWNILQAMGIPEKDIPQFADPMHWCTYFPPLATADIKAFGGQVDWRRSFITTDANPFYDAFIRWQFNKLREKDLVRFGKRHTIYSPRDGQACMDHDRASGEGVDAEEFTGVKLLVVAYEGSSEEVKGMLDSIRGQEQQVFLLAATLRPETMYGQTNCWIGPDLEYGCYRVSEGEYAVCTHRAARNLSFQGWSRVHGQVEQVGSPFLGKDLIGTVLRAPLAVHERVYVLPMMTVSAIKGTGIVTSVPSNSPDDYAALRDLREKPALRSKYGIKDEHVLPFTPIPIIETPSLGSLPAEQVIKDLNVKSQNDRDLLERAKETCYKEDFYSGRMLVGEYAGLAVSEAKPRIRELLLESNQAIIYYCPKGIVMSRSGEECVVALIDQWYLAYGDPTWLSLAKLCLSRMNCFSEEVRRNFEHTLDWMHQWACSRSFGLGSRVPWDPQYLIESLSDSTIYMAYYTVAHLLHQGSLDGSIRPNGINPEQMRDEVWDYIFGHREDKESVSKVSGIKEDMLVWMRREFTYWYPLDLRVSGKDLVSNHLTMFIYNHVALFPEHLWPRSIRANGHLLLNSAKMSKSTGNFMTLEDAVKEYGADATRLALADAGDSVEDANFLHDIANGAILRLFTLKELAEGILAAKGDVLLGEGGKWEASVGCPYRAGHSPACFADRVFEAEIEQAAVRCQSLYEQALYREVLKHGFYELQNARDRYRDMTVLHDKPGSESFGMQHSLMMRYLEVQARILAPITPHLSDYIWRELLDRPGTVLFNTSLASIKPTTSTATAKATEKRTEDVLAANAFVIHVAHDFRAQLSKASTTAQSINAATIYVASDYPAWQRKVHALCKEEDNASSLQDSKAFMERIAREAVPLAKGPKSLQKLVVSYAASYRKSILEPPSVTTTTTTTDNDYLQPRFDEYSTLQQCINYLGSSLKLRIQVESVNADEWSVEGTPQPIPLKPSIRFYYDREWAEKDGRVIDVAAMTGEGEEEEKLGDLTRALKDVRVKAD